MQVLSNIIHGVTATRKNKLIFTMTSLDVDDVIASEKRRHHHYPYSSIATSGRVYRKYTVSTRNICLYPAAEPQDAADPVVADGGLGFSAHHSAELDCCRSSKPRCRKLPLPDRHRQLVRPHPGRLVTTRKLLPRVQFHGRVLSRM